MLFTKFTKFTNLYKTVFFTSKSIIAFSIQTPSSFSSRSLYKKNSFFISDYWKLQVFPHIQRQAQQVIKQLTNQNFNQNYATKMLDDYLMFGNQTFFSKRTPLGCMAVLAAMHSRKNTSVLTYSPRIIDFISELDNKIDNLDQNMLFCYLKSHQERQNQHIVKNKRAFMRLRFASMVKNHFNLIKDDYLGIFLAEIDDVINNQRHNIINTMRYIQVFDKVQNRICQLIQQYFSISNSRRKAEITELINAQFLRRYGRLLKKFEFIDRRSAEILMKFLFQSPILQEFNLQFVLSFSKIFCNIAYFYIPQEGKTIRQKIFEYFQKRYQNNEYIKKVYLQLKQYHRTFIAYNYYHQMLCKTFLNFKFVAINNQFNVLYRNQYKNPVLSNFFWKIFNNDIRLMQSAFRNYDLLKQVYPQKVTGKSSMKILEDKYIIPMQNQMTIRMEVALKRMKIKYEKQFIIKQRNVDFLLVEQNIMLQLDGDYHLNSRTLEINAATAFRNMQILMQKYKLIVINIHEYNMNRSVQLLQKLLAKKIKLIMQNDIVYVQ